MANAFMIGTQIGPKEYITSFAVDSNLGYTQSEAARIYSICYLCDTAGVLICTVLAKFLSPTILLATAVNGILITSISMLVWGSSSKLSLTLSVGLFTTFQGPAWAGIYNWTDNFLNLLSVTLAFARMLRSVADAIIHLIIGHLYVSVGPWNIFLATLINASLLWIIFGAICFITRNQESRYQSTRTQVPHEEVLIEMNDLQSLTCNHI